MLVGDVSIISAQLGMDRIGAYKTSYDNIKLVSRGYKSAVDMINEAQTANTIQTWGLRFVASS